MAEYCLENFKIDQRMLWLSVWHQ